MWVFIPIIPIVCLCFLMSWNDLHFGRSNLDHLLRIVHFSSHGNLGCDWKPPQKNGHGSIPEKIPIFRRMKLHKSQLFWCELQGYKVTWPIPGIGTDFDWIFEKLPRPVMNIQTTSDRRTLRMLHGMWRVYHKSLVGGLEHVLWLSIRWEY